MKYITLTGLDERTCLFSQTRETMMEAHGRKSKWQLKPIIPSFLPSRFDKYSVYISQKALPCFYSNVPRHSAGEINDLGSKSICGCTALTGQNTSVDALERVINHKVPWPNTCILSKSCEEGVWILNMSLKTVSHIWCQFLEGRGGHTEAAPPWLCAPHTAKC